MIWKVPDMWRGGECWIMGGGPSMPRQFGVPENIIQSVMKRKSPPDVYSDYLSPIHNKHVIGVNNIYQIGDWIDVLYFGDCSWYLVHRMRLAQFPKLKVTSCNRFERKKPEESEGIKYLPKDKAHKHGISENLKALSWNANSGGAAINLAVHFGVKRIILLGFDMRSDDDGTSHWHGSHEKKTKVSKGEKRRSPPYARHLKWFPKIAEDAKNRGIEIINASPISRIECFPKVEVGKLL